MAKCSRRFEKLAIHSFENERGGDYRSIGSQTSKCPWQSADKLRIFGKSIQHFDGVNFPAKLYSSPTFWQRLDVAKLVSMSIPRAAVQSLDEGRRRGYYDTLPELRSLTITDQIGKTYPQVNIRAIFPNLIDLSVAGVAFSPFDLRTVTLNHVSPLTAWYLKLLWQLGLHETVQDLSFSFPSDTIQPNLLEHLSKFQNLKTLSIDIYGTGDISELTEAFKHMPQIENMFIKTHTRRPQRDWSNFLTFVAGNISRNVKLFDFDGPYLYRSYWDKFIALMPSTCDCVMNVELLI